jgi:hypothetical protein
MAVIVKGFKELKTERVLAGLEWNVEFELEVFSETVVLVAHELFNT